MQPDPPGDPVDLAVQYAVIAQSGHPISDVVAARLEQALETATDVRVVAAALGALVRVGGDERAHRAWTIGSQSPVAAIRRRASELSPQLVSPSSATLIALVEDSDDLVAEAACWAGGEVSWSGAEQAFVVAAVVAAAGHADPIVREAAVAALGAIGDPAGLPAILTACTDRPTVRRRAVLALAPFEGPEVEAALRVALDDSDWQTRQAAEDLL